VLCRLERKINLHKLPYNASTGIIHIILAARDRKLLYVVSIHHSSDVARPLS